MSLRPIVLNSQLAIAIAALAILSATAMNSQAIVIPLIDAGGTTIDGTLIDLSTGGDTTVGITGSFAADPADFAADTSADVRWNNNEYDYGPAGATGVATWTFGGLTSGSMWDVFASWGNAGQGNLSQMAPYTVQGGAVLVDQEAGATGDLILNDGNAGVEFQKLGTATVSGAGEVVVTLSGAADDWVIADAIALAPFNAPDLLPKLTIDRDTGGMTITNGTGAPINLLAYSLTSLGGAFDSTGWKSIAENYDADGPGAGTGTVDNNDNWTVFSDAADPTDLSEGELDAGDGATFAIGQSIDLGTPWLQSPTEDVTFEYLLNDVDGTVVVGTTEYVGNGDASFLFGDLNGDGTAFALDDFTDEMLPNLVSDLTTPSGVVAYLAGDLDGDFDVDRDDFRVFKNAFVAGGGSAAALTAAAAVPEPPAALLALAAVALVCPIALRRRRSLAQVADSSTPRTENNSMIRSCHWVLAVMLIAITASTASAQLVTVLDDDADRDFAAGPDVTTVGISTHDNGGFGINADAYNDTFAFNLDMSDTTATATYTFNGLSSGRDYNVYAYWRGQANTPQAQYAVGDGGATTLVDQLVRSAADILITDPDPAGNNGALGTAFPFQSLGLITEDGDGQLVITLNNGGASGGFFLADAVAVALVVDPLVLEVNETTGNASIRNEGQDTFNIDTYQIASDTGGVGSLDSTWAGLPGWTNGGASDEFLLSDFNLASSTEFAPTDSVSIGHAFDTSVGNKDLTFSYTTDDGAVFDGTVRYITGGAVLGDYNGNGTVDAADYTIWRDNLGAGNESAFAAGTGNGGGVDASDYTFWKSNFGDTSGSGSLATAEVPEPSTALLALLGIAGAFGLARRRSGKSSMVPAMTCMAVATVVAWAVAGSTALATVTNDREYSFGEDSLETGSQGGTIGTNSVAANTTVDSKGPTGAFVDLLQSGGATYDNVGPGGLNRPGALAGHFGARFDGNDDFLQGIRLGLPSTSISATGGAAVPPGPLNYDGISNRGFQLWARPDAAGNGSAQSLVADTEQHGVRINAAGNWEMQYAGGLFDSGTSVDFDAWSHVMVVRPSGAANGARLYVDGIAIAAAPGGYAGGDDTPLVVGANTGTGEDGSPDPGTADFYDGVIDDLDVFVLGTATAGPDYGDFDPAEHNEFISDALAATIAGDLTGDNLVTGADSDVFVANWKTENLVGGIRVGDLTSRALGDYNLSGRVDLADAFVLHNALLAGGQGGLDFSRLGAEGVPEPASIALLAIAGLGLWRIRHRVAV